MPSLDTLVYAYLMQRVATHYGPFAPPGMPLIAKILQSRPFWECPLGCVWDHGDNPKRPFPCNDYPRLVVTLAAAVVEDQECERSRTATPPQLYWQTVEALGVLRTRCEFFLSERAAGHLSAAAQAANAYLHGDTLRQWLSGVQQAVLALTPANYAAVHPNRPHTLHARMRAAFRTHGPTDRRFNQMARESAIADILIECGIGQGTTSTVKIFRGPRGAPRRSAPANLHRTDPPSPRRSSSLAHL